MGRGLAIMCTTSSITSVYHYFFILFTNPFFSPIFDHNPPYLTNNIYNAYQFSNDNHTFPLFWIFTFSSPFILISRSYFIIFPPFSSSFDHNTPHQQYLQKLTKGSSDNDILPKLPLQQLSHTLR